MFGGDMMIMRLGVHGRIAQVGPREPFRRGPWGCVDGRCCALCCELYAVCLLELPRNWLALQLARPPHRPAWGGALRPTCEPARLFGPERRLRAIGGRAGSSQLTSRVEAKDLRSITS